MALHRFKRRLILGFFLSLLPFLAMIFYLFDLWFDTSRSAHLESRLLNAQAMAAYVQAVFDRALTDTSLVASEDLVKSLKLEIINKRLVALVATSPFYTHAAFFDQNGNIITATGNTTTPFIITDRSYFTELVEVNQPVVSDVIIGRIANQVTVIASSPIEDENTKLKGAIVVGIDISQLGEKMQELLTLKENTTLALINGKGKLAFATTIPDPSEEDRNRFESLLPVQKALAGEVAVIEDKKLPGLSGSQLGVVVPIHGYRWAVAIVDSSEDVFSIILSTQRYFFIIVILSIGFFTAVTLLTIRRILSTI